ncbi:exonuclease SbcCD subunit D [Clostridium sp.]|uniref:exonuclease SbcCD subunit D n=1 Tax=Clostridium sp. TaxID=1506 RepID=UPI003463A5A6
MQGVKILHCGDLHFDTPFKEGDNDFSEKRKEDLRETFSNILNKSLEEKVDLVLIAGDFFDNMTLTKTTLNFIQRKLEEVKPLKIFISPGNHDPFNEKSLYSLINWPSNVHIFKEEIEKVYIDELNVNIFGIGFKETHVKESLLKGFNDKYDLKNSKEINLMVIHGEIAKGEEINNYNPITFKEIGDSNLNYIALGHRHSFSKIQREKNTYYSYSGNPEGRGFHETGDKGVVIGNVYKDYVDLKFLPLCKRRYEILDVNIEGAKDYETIESLILKEVSNEDRLKNLYRIILKGELKDDFIINKDLLEEKLSSKFYYVKVQDKTILSIDYESLSKEISIKGIYARRMLDLIKKEEDSLKRHKLYEALKIGIQSLTEREVTIQ